MKFNLKIMPIKDTEVYKYIEGVKRYFDNDLEIFSNVMADFITSGRKDEMLHVI